MAGDLFDHDQHWQARGRGAERWRPHFEALLWFCFSSNSFFLIPPLKMSRNICPDEPPSQSRGLLGSIPGVVAEGWPHTFLHTKRPPSSNMKDQRMFLHLSDRMSWSDEVLCRMLFKDLTSEELLSNRKLKNSCNAVSPLQVILLQSSLTSVWTAAIGGSLSFLLLSLFFTTLKSQADASVPLSSVTLWLQLSNSQIKPSCRKNFTQKSRAAPRGSGKSSNLYAFVWNLESFLRSLLCSYCWFSDSHICKCSTFPQQLHWHFI